MSFLFGKKKKKHVQSPMERTEELNELITRLQKKEEYQQTQIEKHRAEARKWAQAGNKRKAMESIKRAKAVENSQKKVSDMRFNLETQKEQLQDAATSADVFDQMQKNNETLKAQFGNMDLEKVQEVLDDIDETQANLQEVTDALTRPMAGGVDEMEVEDEFNDLMADLENEDTEAAVAAPARPQKVAVPAGGGDDEAALGNLMASFS